MFNRLKRALEELYLAFSGFELGKLEDVSCFDYGPTNQEVADLARPLRDIPNRTMAKMEFYAFGWDSWGSKQEAGYFLPRLMTYLAEDITRLREPALFSLFKYKLQGVLSHPSKDWTDRQIEALREFFVSLLEQHLSVDTEVGMLIECVLAVGLDSQTIFANWNSSEPLYARQTEAILRHFRYTDPDRDIPKGLYFDDREIVQSFVAHLVS